MVDRLSGEETVTLSDELVVAKTISSPSLEYKAAARSVVKDTTSDKQEREQDTKETTTTKKHWTKMEKRSTRQALLTAGVIFFS
jgi:hypothetical protein